MTEGNLPSTNETLETSMPEPIDAPGRTAIPVQGRKDSDVCSGSTLQLKWGARSDVGLVRDHNEDSYLVQPPLFCVCDGMGGHAAGEVASRIAVETIAKTAPHGADDVLLGEAIEAANHAVIEASQNGVGKPGMGCTATAVIIASNLMAVAHVGDSRCYVLHAGKLVRLTHDHSYVEELVDAGEITADEARVHPSRSIVTRALGSDMDMYADHFLIEVDEGDRIILCSDGLNSMVPDAVIESLAVSCATPQQAADTLVSEALTQGGHDNISVVVIDVAQDMHAQRHSIKQARAFMHWLIGLILVVALIFVSTSYLIGTNWFIGIDGTNVGIYQGINAHFLGIPLSHLSEKTSIKVKDLPQALQKQLTDGIEVESSEKAHVTVESYRNQIKFEQEKAQKVSEATGINANKDTGSDPVDVPDGNGGE